MVNFDTSERQEHLRQNRQRQNRLIVLIPESLAGNLTLARKIFWIAIRDHSEVVYLALVDNDDNHSTVRRGMATMKAITADECLAIQSKLIRTSCWLKELRAVYQSGDRIVCNQEQTVKNGFLKTVPVSMFLQDVLHFPVITISGFYKPQQDQFVRWIRTIVSWIGFFLILAGFTMLEIRLDSLTVGAYGKVLLFIVLLVEIGAIWAWNLITG